jgi:hypothetical protein
MTSFAAKTKAPGKSRKVASQIKHIHTIKTTEVLAAHHFSLFVRIQEEEDSNHNILNDRDENALDAYLQTKTTNYL